MAVPVLYRPCSRPLKTRRQLGVHVGCTDQSKQQAAAVNKTSRVCHKIPWNNTRIYRPETFSAHSSLTKLFAREFLNHFDKTTREGKVLQSVPTISFKAVVVIDITCVVSAQTSSFIFTVQTAFKSV